MVFNFKPTKQTQSNRGFHKLKNAVYMLSIKEWNIDWFLYHFLWFPFKWIGSKVKFLSRPASVFLLFILFAAGVLHFILEENVSVQLNYIISHVLAVVGQVSILSSFSQLADARTA